MNSKLKVAILSIVISITGKSELFAQSPHPKAPILQEQEAIELAKQINFLKIQARAALLKAQDAMIQLQQESLGTISKEIEMTEMSELIRSKINQIDSLEDVRAVIELTQQLNELTARLKEAPIQN